METSTFIPRRLSNLEHIKDFSSDSIVDIKPHIAEIIDQYKKIVADGIMTDIGLRQISWMGRGCYRKIGNDSYLIGKGTGPGFGSEMMRRFLDDLQAIWAKNDGKYGGCLRVNLSSQWPFLVQYIIDENGNLEIIDPRPEGFSIFGATYRESLAGNIYDKIGIDIIRPVSLYRENTAVKWSGNKELFRQELSKNVISELSTWNTRIMSCLINHDDYHDLDAGILFRHAKTPFRISNLLDVCIENDFGTYKKIISSLVHKSDINKQDIYNLQKFVTETLAKNAALMFRNGIIHGQFRTHYQNVSLLGELSDFDSTIFLSLLDNQGGVNALDGFISNMVEQFKDDLLAGEDEYGLKMYKFVEDDLRIFAGVQPNGTINKNVLYSNIIGQVYDIYNQCMRLNDLFERHNRKDLSNGGTVMNGKKYNELNGLFISTLKQILTKDDLIFIRNVLMDYFEEFKNTYLSKRLGDVSIYGWKHKKKLNYLKDVLTKNDIDNTCLEALSIFDRLISE